MNDIFEVDFIVQLHSIDMKEPNKNEKSWGYGATFFRLLFSGGWIDDEQQNPFSVVCSQRTSLYPVKKYLRRRFVLSKYM